MKKVLSLIIAISLFMAFKQTVSAHVLSTNKSIGAVIHIEPDDDPIIGQEATFLLEFKDKNNEFSLGDCQCNVTIKTNGKELLNQALLTNNDPLNAYFTYTFPEKNVYTITISGKSMQENKFENFSLEYDIRVTREENKEEKNDSVKWVSSHSIHLLVAVVIFLLSIAALIKKLISKRKKTDS